MILKVGMQHWVLEYVLPSCSNDDPGLTLSYFTARSNLVPYSFVWGKGKAMDDAVNLMRTWTDMNIKGQGHSLTFLLWNQEADDLEAWYTASGTRVLPMFLYGDPGLTLTIFMTGSNLFLNASAWVKTYTALNANVFPSLFLFIISSALRWAIQDQ